MAGENIYETKCQILLNRIQPLVTAIILYMKKRKKKKKEEFSLYFNLEKAIYIQRHSLSLISL